MSPRIIMLLSMALLAQPAQSLARPVLDLPRKDKRNELCLARGVTMKLAWIQAGKFMMGSPESEEGRDQGEVQHEVEITRPFYMGMHEVTRGQYRAFVDATGYKTHGETSGEGGWGYAVGYDPIYSWRYVGFGQTDDHPVINITWGDVLAFCQWLGRKEGRMVDLPTEAEWEYACRAGTTTPYYCGSLPNSLQGHGNVSDLTTQRGLGGADSIFDFEDGHVFTAPVGQFKANPWGLFDMHGNAGEFCKDVGGPLTAGRAVDPQGPGGKGGHVVRGGSWFTSPSATRSASRYYDGRPHAPFTDVGFRVVVR